MRTMRALALLALLAFSGSALLAGRAYASDVAADAAAGSATAGTPSHVPPPDAQKHSFQAEVSRLMDIIVNSLYSNKDVFLRELISNAADALDKIRFLSITDKAMLGEGDNAQLEIKIRLDKEKRVLEIRDRGVGMTKEELIKNLGTIAKSGTSAFLESMQKGGDINLIGQFGVGFYSVYLVADWVDVISKHNDDVQYVWSSAADGTFNIWEDKDGEQLGRGTLIRLHLKPEAVEYADEAKLKELVQRYSGFINFPIYLLEEKEVDVPIEEEGEKKDEDKKEEAKEDDKEDETEEEDDGVEDSSDDEEDKDKPKTRKEKRPSWELLNDAKAIWLRKPAEVTDEEYQKFYKAVSKDYSDALTWAHFKAEGDVEFKAITFIPKVAPHDFYDKYYEKGARNSLKLYVRRVFISDDVEDLLPRYLGFARGIVDSDTLPLSVSREMLQQSAALKTIKKKLSRKVLDLIKKLADDEVACAKDEETEKGEDCKKYGEFWGQFGRAIKLGVIEDTTNRNRLAKLLRFHTSKATDKLTSLDEYIERMKEGQKHIYFLAGQSKDEVAASPFLEQLLAKGYEVIYFTDVLDEYVMQHMLEYDDKKFADASKEDLKLADKDEDEIKSDKELKEKFKPLATWWKKVLGDSKVSSVKVSSRLESTPCVVVAGKYGQSANMERIMKAQAFGDPSRQAYMRSQRSLEINAKHPLIVALRDKVAADESDASAEQAAKLLFDAALLESGFLHDEPKAFSQRVYSLVRGAMGVEAGADEPAAEAPEEVPTEPPPKEEL